MKKRLLTSMVAALLAVSVHAQNLASDGFGVPASYSAGASVVGQNGGLGFAGEWLSGGGQTEANLIAVDAGLTYLNLDTNDGSLLNSGSGYSKLRRQVAEGDQSNTSVFFSYLYQVGAMNNHLDYFSFGEALGQERIRIKNNGNGELDVIYKKQSDVTLATTSGLNLQNGTLVFVVGEYQIGVGGANDKLVLYFNPSDLSDVAGTASVRLEVIENNTAGYEFAFGFEFMQITFNAVDTQYDEIRFAYGDGASIADVVPVR